MSRDAFLDSSALELLAGNNQRQAKSNGYLTFTRLTVSLLNHLPVVLCLLDQSKFIGASSPAEQRNEEPVHRVCATATEASAGHEWRRKLPMGQPKGPRKTDPHRQVTVRKRVRRG